MQTRAWPYDIAKLSHTLLPVPARARLSRALLAFHFRSTVCEIPLPIYCEKIALGSLKITRRFRKHRLSSLCISLVDLALPYALSSVVFCRCCTIKRTARSGKFITNNACVCDKRMSLIGKFLTIASKIVRLYNIDPGR